MSEKKAQVLVLDPAVDLVFKGPFTEVVTSTLTLKNPTNESIIFKVKTTAPKQYCVRPNSGLLKPQEESTISVMLQPFEQNSAEKSKHKFMVQTMIAPSGFQLESLDIVWREASKSQLMDSKLRCVFLDSQGGPLAEPSSTSVKTTEPPALSSTTPDEDTSKSSLSKSSVSPATTTTVTPKQEQPTSVQSTAGSTPAHVGGSNNKEMEKAAVESRMRMLQDRIDQLSSENTLLKSESNKLRQRIGLGASSTKVSGGTVTNSKAKNISLFAIMFILVAIILGYLVGKWL